MGITFVNLTQLYCNCLSRLHCDFSLLLYHFAKSKSHAISSIFKYVNLVLVPPCAESPKEPV